MVLLLKLSLILVLSVMFIQDMRYRGISWPLFPSLAFLLILLNKYISYYELLINNSFIFIVLTLLTIWVSVKEGKITNLAHSYLGLGDILFLVCISTYFSPVNFFFFYLFSLILITLFTGIYYLIDKPLNLTIPLSGLQGGVLLILFIVCWYLDIDPGHHVFFENYVLNKFYLLL